MNQDQSKRPIRVFLSHAAADREMAHELRQRLIASGARLFSIDMLSAGGPWQTRLREELVASDVFVVVLSPNALKSDFVLQEIGAAWALDKRVVVVATDDRVALPAGLDLAADVVVTDLEAVDAILQHAGRVSRSGASGTGTAA